MLTLGDLMRMSQIHHTPLQLSSGSPRGTRINPHTSFGPTRPTRLALLSSRHFPPPLSHRAPAHWSSSASSPWASARAVPSAGTAGLPLPWLTLSTLQGPAKCHLRDRPPLATHTKAIVSLHSLSLFVFFIVLQHSVCNDS